MSVREITRRVGVSKSSVSLWVRGLPLTPEQRERLTAQNPRYGAQNLGAAANALRARRARARWHDDVRALAQGGDPEFAAGCMLYWAEGSKTHNVARLSNSDPEVVRFLVNFLRRHFAVDDECRVSVHGTQVVQTIYGAIQEYGGFGRPEWLD